MKNAECKFTCDSVFFIISGYLKAWHDTYWRAKRVDKGGHDCSQFNNEFPSSQDILILFRKKVGYLPANPYIINSYLQVTGAKEMNYYERIQKSIDFIEDNLTEEITIDECARQAYMSVSGYYRIFLSVVGYNVKEYIRMRRLALAYEELVQGEQSVITVATKYAYNSTDSFTRAFKNQFGIVPSKVKSVSSQLEKDKFARLNIMEKYFEENSELAERYPEIKVIKKLEPMKVACFTYFGEDPEGHAFEEMKKWTREHGMAFHNQDYRVFGYNNPDPSNEDEIYGYEVCITIPDELYDSLQDVPEGFTKGTYDGVKRRVLSGGKFAVTSVKREGTEDIGEEIAKSWQRFSAWLHESKYIWGGNQYLEEHLGFTEEDDHIGGVDLYISIQDAPKETLGIKEE